jgi:hypothetical protein
MIFNARCLKLSLASAVTAASMEAAAGIPSALTSNQNIPFFVDINF